MAVDIATIGVAVDTRQVKTASRDLDSFGKSANKASREADGSSKAMAGVAASAARLLSVIGVAGLLSALPRLTDQYTKLTAQLRIASRTQEDYIKSYGDVVRISNLAQTSLEGTATLYARLANTLKDTNVTQQQFARITESVALGLRVSGASTGEAQSAMLQLSQAFAAGVLRGEEFNAVSEASFPLMKALADSMGIPIEQLRSMAMEGKITRDELVKAFSDPALIESFRKQSEQLNTISGAFQVLKNNVGIAVGEIDNATGASAALAKVLLDFANSQYIRVPFETIAVLAANVAYVFKAVGNEIGGIAARLAALVSFDYEAALVTIPEMMKEDAIEARKEIDRVTEAILNPKVTGSPVSQEMGTIKNYATSALETTTKLTEKQKAMLDYHERINKSIIEQIELRAKLYRDDEAYVLSQSNAQAEMLESLIEKADAMQVELDNYDKLESAIYATALARAVEKKEMLASMGLATDGIEKEIAARKRLLDLSIVKERKDAEKKAASEALRITEKLEEDRRRAQEETAKELERSITDALMRGFENGLGFAQNFKDTLINMFKTLVLRPIIQAVVSPVANSISSAFSGIFGGQGGGITSIFGGSGGNSLIGTIRDGFSALNSDVVGAVGDLGTFLSTGNGGLGDKIGGFLGQYQSQIATALSFAPAVFSLLSGDIKGAAFQGAGAALGTVLGGPVGGAIGSFLGGAVGGLFGGSGEKYKQVFQTGTSTFDGSAFSQKLGIDVRAGKQMQKTLSGIQEAFSRNLYTILDEFDMGSKISTSIYARLRRTSGRTASQFKYNVGGARGGASSGIGPGLLRIEEFETDGDIGKGIKKLSEVVLGKVLVQAIQRSQLPEGIRALFAGFKKSSAVNEMIGAVINLNRAADGLNERFGLTVDEAAKVSKQLGFTGQELTKFVNEFATLANGFNTVGAALIRARDDLTEAYGTALPASLKEFDAALKAIDTTTKAGIKTFAELFSLRGSFEQYQAAIDGLKGNVRGAIYSMVSDQEKLSMQTEDMRKIFSELGYTVPSSIQELVNLGKSIDFTTEEGLNLAAVFPTLVQAFQAVNGQASALRDTLNALDINRFKTQFEYSRAQIYQASGIPLSMMPSYDVGTPFVPQTGPAMIHRGERILTAKENASFGELVTELRAIKDENRNMRAELQSIAVTNSKVQKSVDRLERDGFIMRDVGIDGNEQIIKVEVVS